jgi:hypothetical protein
LIEYNKLICKEMRSNAVEKESNQGGKMSNKVKED